jgi:hopene-associated glycosyltransferase HpnB
MLPLAAISLAVWAYLLLGHGRFWQGGPMLAPAVPAQTPSVSVIVPARDEEETIERALRSLLAQTYAGVMQVILVDDQSRDGTAQAAAMIADPRLVVIEGTERKPGWSGKLWALSQGVEAATGDLLLFTDADIEHQPAHLATLAAKLTGDGLDLVSEMVALNCRSAAERALVPAFVFFFTLLYPFQNVNDPASPVAAAAGGTVLIRAEILRRIGGLADLRGALIDDVALAARVKRIGKIWLGHSRLAASIRAYPHAADVWRMVARTAYVQLRFSPLLLAGTVLGMVLVWLVPPLAAVFGQGAARLAGLLGWIAMTCAYVPTLLRFGLRLQWALVLPLTALFYTAATVGSATDHYSGRGVMWKRRSYTDAH